MVVCLCVCCLWEEIGAAGFEKRVQSVALELSQTPLSFNMPFPAWISLSHVTELDAHTSFSHLLPFLMSPLFFSSPFPSPRCCIHPTPPDTTDTISAATKSDSLSICHFLANLFFFGHPAQGFLARTNTFKSRKCSVLLRRPKRGRDDYWGWISRKIHRWQKLSKTDKTFVKLCVSTLCQFLKWFVSVIQPWFMLEGSLRVDPYLCWQWVN